MPSTATDRLAGLTTSVAVKAPCRLKTTANHALSGLSAIDGVTPAADDRILVGSNTDATENGIYNAQAGDWTRALDFDGSLDAVGGTQVSVTSGTASGGTYWRVSGNGAVDIATDEIEFEPGSVDTAAAITFTPAGTGATSRTVQDKLRDVISVKDYGALGNDSGNDAAAFQAALDYLVSIGGGCLYVPNGIYRIGTMLTISASVNGIRISGQSQVGTTLKCTITGAAANPLLKIDSTGISFTLDNIELLGNSTTGAGGNGNALSCISPNGGLNPQVVNLYNVNIRGFQGTGKDHAGSSIPSAAWYGYQSTNWSAHGCIFTNNAMGLRFDTIENSSLHGCLMDANAKNSVYLSTCHAISFHGCSAQSSGSGGTTDGNVYLATCESIAWYGGELKNGNPYLLNAGATNITNNNLRLDGIYLSQLDDTKGHTALLIGNGASNVHISSCSFIFVNGITDGVGVNIVQNIGGYTMSGLRIAGNNFSIGFGGTIAKCVFFNGLTNQCDAPVISGNTFGFYLGAGSPTTITNGVRIEGDVRSALIESNAFLAGPNWTITNAIYFGTSTLAPIVRGNEYITDGGTITAQVNNAAAISYEREDRAGGRLLLGSATYDPGSLTTNTGATTTVTVTGAALGDYVEGISFSLDLQGISLTGYVSAADTVSARFQNGTAGTLDLASGTLRAKVRTQQ